METFCRYFYFEGSEIRGLRKDRDREAESDEAQAVSQPIRNAKRVRASGFSTLAQRVGAGIAHGLEGRAREEEGRPGTT
jgi:hypothetical protein